MRLTPHPSTPLPPGWSLLAHGDAGPAMVRFEWTLQADLARVRLPPVGTPARRDGLWRHTCFEVFVADPAGDGYREFNFSPSAEWAAYGFARYRDGMVELGLDEPPQIAVAPGGGGFVLTATMPRSAVGAALGAPPATRRCAFAAVIEYADGNVAYLALAHPPGRPDFHHRDGFVARIEL